MEMMMKNYYNNSKFLIKKTKKMIQFSPFGDDTEHVKQVFEPEIL